MNVILKNRFEFFFSLLIIILPFSRALPNIILVLLFLIYLLDVKKIRVSKLNFTFKIQIALFFYLIIKSIFFGFFIEDLSYYSLLSIVILVPILFLKVQNFDMLKKAILVSVNLSLLFSLYKILIYYLNYGYLPFNDGWAVNKILVLERPYAGFFSLISIIISFDLYKKEVGYKTLYLLSLIVSIFFLFIISARISILSFIIILFIYLFITIKSGIKYKMQLIVFSSTLFISAFFLNQNLAKRFFLKSDFHTSYTIAKDSEPRIIIWGCAKKIITSEGFNNLIGISSYEKVKQELTQCYSTSIDNIQKRSWFLNQKYNTHNQFIGIYLLGGIISISLFLSFIVISFYLTRNNFFGLSIMIAITLFLFVENLFQRQFGIYIFIITYSVYFSQLKEIKLFNISNLKIDK